MYSDSVIEEKITSIQLAKIVGLPHGQFIGVLDDVMYWTGFHTSECASGLDASKSDTVFQLSRGQANAFLHAYSKRKLDAWLHGLINIMGCVE